MTGRSVTSGPDAQMPSSHVGDKVHVRPLAQSDWDGLDAFLKEHDGGLIYYSKVYQDFLQRLLGCESRYKVAVTPGGQVVGALPLMKLVNTDGRAVLNSLPFFGSHGGPLANDATVLDLLLEAYAEEVAQPDIAASTFIENPLAPLADTPKHDLRDERISQITDINCSPEDLMASFDSSARRNIRKADRLGITVSVVNDAWDFLKRVHVENMEAIGGTPKAPEFFESIPATMQPGSDYRIYIAHHDARPVAALLLLYYGKVVEYFVPVIEHDARSNQPLALVAYKAMCEARELGYTMWNWGGTWLTQSGVYQFKKKFAATERRYRYFTQIADKSMLARTPEDLLAGYPGFYVAPFGALENQNTHKSEG